MGNDHFLVDDFSYTDFFVSQRQVQCRQKQGTYRITGSSLERGCFHEGKVDIFIFPWCTVYPEHSLLILDASKGFFVIFGHQSTHVSVILVNFALEFGISPPIFF